MNTVTPAVLNSFAADLVRRGLPVEYAERAGAELADHYGDLVDKLRTCSLDDQAAHAEASRRLGDSRTLVQKTVRDYQRRYWCGRWPLVTFVLAPVPALGLLWIGMAAILNGASLVCDLLGVELSQVDGRTTFIERCIIEGMWGAGFLIAPVLVIALFAGLARRCGLALSWGVVVGVQMALFIGLTQFNVDYQRGMLQLGWPIEMPSYASWIGWYFNGTWRHSLQVAVPLFLGLVIVVVQMAGRRRASDLIAC